MDAYTKQLLAYVVSDSLQVDFVLETINNLVRDHGVSLNSETLINSDQGVQYRSLKFIQLIKDVDRDNRCPEKRIVGITHRKRASLAI